MEEATPLSAIAWLLGWVLAVAALFWAGLRLPLQTRLTRGAAWLYNAGVIVVGAGVAVLANVALILHDTHIDLTREKIFTPSAMALAVVDELRQPVKLTYFFSGQDPAGRRLKDVLDVMGHRNALLEVHSVDPDRQPAVARAFGIQAPNIGVLEAEGRKVAVRTTDESEIAIGIQRVLRQKSITVCFLEGHNEFPMDNFEFHTHLDGIAGHSHDDASSKLVQTTGHGIGRLRRALEAQGYDTRKVVLAIEPAVPPDCQVLIVANPRTTFLPGESAALEAYLQAGGAVLAMLDLGFVPEPRLASLLEKLGVRLPQDAVVDPLSHYSTDAEMVAVTAYDATPVIRNLSMTFFPGVRPLVAVPPAPGIVHFALFSSSRDSYVRPVAPVAVREVAAGSTDAPAHRGAPGARPLAVAAEGKLPGSAPDAPPFRAIVVGDGDFASNSFLPYLANSDLALALVRWLVREERSTVVASRIPVPPMILLSGAQMRAIFVALVIVLPVLVVTIGAALWWWRR